jgi:DNA-binding NarL/FixJ family response regulator
LFYGVKMVKKQLVEQTTSLSCRRVLLLAGPALRRSLARIISHEKDLSLCGEECDPLDALKALPRLQPSLAIVDLESGSGSSQSLIKELRRRRPKLKILAVSNQNGASFVDKTLRAGADGFIGKTDAASEELAHAIRDVLSGYIYVTEEVEVAERNAAEKTKRKEKRLRPKLTLRTERELISYASRGVAAGG